MFKNDDRYQNGHVSYSANGAYAVTERNNNVPSMNGFWFMAKLAFVLGILYFVGQAVMSNPATQQILMDLGAL